MGKPIAIPVVSTEHTACGDCYAECRQAAVYYLELLEDRQVQEAAEIREFWEGCRHWHPCVKDALAEVQKRRAQGGYRTGPA